MRYTGLAGPGTVFMVGELEAIYVEMLDGHGIVWSTRSSYTEIRRFLSLSTSLTFLTAPIPVLPDFDSLVHQQGVKKAYECYKVHLMIRPLIKYLELNTTQGNIDQLYDYLKYQPSYHQLMKPSIPYICNINV